MLEFKITQCPEKLQLGHYQHFDAEITFGRSEGDMLIDDPNMADCQAKIYFEGNQAKVQNLDQTADIRVNVTAVHPGQSASIKPKDNITMGKTVLQLITVNVLPPTPPAEYVHHNHAARFAEGNKEHAIFKVLEILEAQERASMDKTAKPPMPAVPSMPPMPPSPPKVNK